MKKFKFILIALVFSLLSASTIDVKAQCAACTASVESSAQSGSKTTKGLNAGIMFLLAAPYLVVAVGAYVWYTKYRRKNVELNIRPEKLNLN
ncbi:hypothetical protein DYU05_14030 [Mucilaginibacter terrenus]|uniref:Uncharacterized protein n=1 Tax=Mucilaginibacter terrenus TaxID=2482727 RepID=A0A3E2NQI1_9SPHI|nr:hypothetical protein [Mucilaginibacter terrenus]RFZ83252.1 hypothetical protein DYU05_14030 [Mucilaginibacter terrenus]